MATQAENQEAALSVRAAVLKSAAGPPSVGSFSGPLTGEQFALIAYHQGSNTWKDLTGFITDLEWSDADSSASMSANVTLSNALAVDGDKTSDYLNKGTLVKILFSLNGNGWDEIGRMTITSIKRSESGGSPSVSFTMFDGIFNLANSHSTFLYYSRNQKKNLPWTAYQITKDICQRFGIPIGHIPKYSKMLHISYIYSEDTSLYDMLLKVWTLERRHSHRRFVIKMVNGKLSITVKKANSRVWEIAGRGGQNIGGLLSSSFTSAINPGDASTGTATQITVRGIKKDASGEEQRHAVIVRKAVNKPLQAQLGVLAKVYTFTDGWLSSRAQADRIARTLLKAQGGFVNSAEVQALGIPYIRAGDAVYIDDPGSALRGIAYVTGVTHHLGSGGEYTMSLELSFTDTVPFLMPDAESLAPIKAIEAGGGGVGPLPPDWDPYRPTDLPSVIKVNMPDWLKVEITKASISINQHAVFGGLQAVSHGWGESKAMELLIRSESNFDPKARNAKSGAYGLFQFLPSTWSTLQKEASVVLGVGPHDIRRPRVQCVYGLLYIRKRYISPDNAWIFHNKNGWY